MTKIRMNTELRNKLFNKIKNVFENEDTQEREAFSDCRSCPTTMFTDFAPLSFAPFKASKLFLHLDY